MSTSGQVHPDDDSWVAAIHASTSDFAPLGAGVVIDDRRILTCEHVIHDEDELWIAFPMADDARRLVKRVVLPDARAPVKDLAVLILADPVPQTVTPAPLRSPRPGDLTALRWWAFGFPAGDPVGNPADGSVGAALGYGWIRLDAESRYHVDPGFSGGGLWSPDYDAVIGVVGQANDRGDGRAITLHQAVGCFPDQNLSQLSERFAPTLAGPIALSAWGWSLSGDPEGVRHWRPRARGVSIDSERGYRFRGRTAALRAITSWLDREALDRRVLVVTGAPGSGKSAVLGRVVTTADASTVAELPDWDTAIRAQAGSVSCAVHAKGKTALEVATEITRAASAALPTRVEDFAPALRDALAQGRGRRFNVIIDALDESPEARIVVAKIILPIAETCADVGAQVVVGSRRRDNDGDLLGSFGVARTVVNLDDEKFFAEGDLAAYARATLQIERNGNPYADDAAADAVATRIAELSDANFLIAGLTARTHGLYDEIAVNPAEMSFTATVDAAMRDYLQRLPPVAGVSAETLLTALAFADAPGLPAVLWQVAVRALTADEVPVVELTKFARSSVANFLVESSAPNGNKSTFRLFHQALNDSLLNLRAQVVAAADDERKLTTAFLAIGRAGWDNAPAYLLRSLARHAARGAMIDDLLTDDGYLLYADLPRLLSAADQAVSASGQQRSRLLRLTPRAAFSADGPIRAAIFGVTEALEDLSPVYLNWTAETPYQAAWGVAMPSTEHAVLEGHTDIVTGVCAFILDGQPLLASASIDETVRIWNPATGTERNILRGHTGDISAVCAFTLDGQPLLASASRDQTIRIWDPATGTERNTLHGHTGGVNAVCPFMLDGRPLLATSGSDQTVRIWDPATGAQQRLLEGRTSGIMAICAFSLKGRTLLACGGVHGQKAKIWDAATGKEVLSLAGDYTDEITSICAFSLGNQTYLTAAAGSGFYHSVRLWDPATGEHLSTLKGHTGEVNAVSTFSMGGYSLLASGSGDQTIRIWNPVTGEQVSVLRGTGTILAMCAVIIGERPMLATCGDGENIRIWDVAASRQLSQPRGHTSGVTSITGFMLNHRPLIVTGSLDQTARIWDPADGSQRYLIKGHTGGITSVSVFDLQRRTVLATSSIDKTVRIWDVTSGAERTVLQGHRNWATCVRSFIMKNRPFLATASTDSTVRIWDPATGAEISVLEGHTGGVTCVCAFTVRGHPFLATGGQDETVRVWDPSDGTQVSVFAGHQGFVRCVCTVILDDRVYLVSGSYDETVRIWDPGTTAERSVLRGHSGWVGAVCAFEVNGHALLATGGRDRTVRIWDTSGSAASLTIPAHQPVLALGYDFNLLLVGTISGHMAIRLNPEFLRPAGR